MTHGRQQARAMTVRSCMRLIIMVLTYGRSIPKEQKCVPNDRKSNGHIWLPETKLIGHLK